MVKATQKFEGLSDEELDKQLTDLSLIEKRRNRLYKFFVIGILAAVVAGHYWGRIGSYIVLFVTLIFFGLLGFFDTSAQKKISALIKENIVHNALYEVFSECIYDPIDWLSSETIIGAQLIDDWQVLEGNDYVEGKYKGHTIAYSDVHLVKLSTRMTTKGAKTERITVFKGQWITCDLDQPLPAMVRIREKLEKYKPELFGVHFNAKTDPELFCVYQNAKSDIVTENTAFNEQFQILTDDPHTAFYVLTPHFMEYILSADRIANGLTLLCFAGDTVHIAVNNWRDSFEAKDLGREFKGLAALQTRIRGEIRYITGILDELFQNDFLFSKEEK